DDVLSNLSLGDGSEGPFAAIDDREAVDPYSVGFGDDYGDDDEHYRIHPVVAVVVVVVVAVVGVVAVAAVGNPPEQKIHLHWHLHYTDSCLLGVSFQNLTAEPGVEPCIFVASAETEPT